MSDLGFNLRMAEEHMKSAHTAFCLLPDKQAMGSHERWILEQIRRQAETILAADDGRKAA